MNKVLCGYVWSQYPAGRPLGSCAYGELLRVPWGYLISFSEQPAGWCFYGPCTQGAGVAASTLSSQRGPHWPPGLASPFLGSCCSPLPPSPGWQDGVSLPILVFPAGDLCPWLLPRCPGVHSTLGCPSAPCPLKPRGAVGGSGKQRSRRGCGQSVLFPPR